MKISGLVINEKLIVHKPENRQVEWSGDVMRMEQNRLHKTIVERGSPRTVSYTHLDVYKRQV